MVLKDNPPSLAKYCVRHYAFGAMAYQYYDR